jgi:hypothetical protein
VTVTSRRVPWRLYTAFVISPKDTRPPEQPPATFAFVVEHIDVEAWQRYFDSFLQILGLAARTSQVSGLSVRQID